MDDKYDPEAAKKALEAAGVKDLSMKIWAMPVSRPYMPNARRTAELMQADLAKVGVKADIVSMEWGEYLKKSSEKDRDGAVIMGWTGDNGVRTTSWGRSSAALALATTTAPSGATSRLRT